MLRSVDIPTTVLNIGDNAFYGIEKRFWSSHQSLLFYEIHSGCSSLSTVVLPTSVSSIGVKAFKGFII